MGKDCVAEGNILANIIWGPQTPDFKGLPLFEAWPFPKHIRIVSEPQLVLDSGPIHKEIHYWWPDGRFEGKNAGKQYMCQYKTDTGFYVDVMTYEQARKDFEGATVGCFVFSEPPPQDIYNACVGRLRRGGIMIFPMTPLMNAAWIEDTLLSDPQTAVVTADIEANCREHGVNGVLEHAHIQDMINSWPPEEIEARVKGKFLHLSNSIFGSSFVPETHLIDDGWYPADTAVQWGISVDPAGSKPFAILYWFVTPTGQLVIDDEWPHDDFFRIKDSKITISDYVQMWKEWETGKVINCRIIDRHFANARDYRGRSLMDDLTQSPPDGYGMDWQNSPNMEEEIGTGILKVKQYLAVNPVTKMPGVLIKKRCVNLRKSLLRWTRDPDTQKPDPTSVYKDFCDALRYVCMTAPQIYVPRPFKPHTPRYSPGR